jgi:hypothetical protein
MSTAAVGLNKFGETSSQSPHSPQFQQSAGGPLLSSFSGFLPHTVNENLTIFITVLFCPFTA